MKTTSKVSANIKSAFILTLLASSIIIGSTVSASKGKNMNNKTLICHVDNNGEQEIIVNNNNVSQHLQHGDNVGTCGQQDAPSDGGDIMPF